MLFYFRSWTLQLGPDNLSDQELAKLEFLTYRAIALLSGYVLVRVEGLEPPRLAAPEPKSGASANFAIPAYI
jgi:hypothetical protein